MVKTTRAQREALKRVFSRHSLYINSYNKPTSNEFNGEVRNYGPISYRQFRKLAQPTFGMDGAIVVPWCGMFLAIEADGYTHS